MLTHSGSYSVSLTNGMWKFHCTCGLTIVGSERDVKCRAAGHDLDDDGLPAPRAKVEEQVS